MTREVCDHPASVLLDWYLNGTLAAGEEDSVRAHLDACDLCTREVEELAAVTAALPAGLPAGRIDAPASRRPPRVRFAYAAAAAVTLPALLGLYWIYLGLPGRPVVSLPALSSVTFELGGGPQRGAGGPLSFDAPAGAGSVTLVFAVPIGEAPSHTLDLFGPGGRTIVSGTPLTGRDPLGDYRFILPAETLLSPGDYQVLVHEAGAGSEGQTFRFPFRVVSGS
jgi:hypothetical protein